MYRLNLSIGVLFVSSACQPSIESSATAMPWLIGEWRTAAFSGEMHETWREAAPGILEQAGRDLEQGDTLYSQTVRIERIGGRLYLIALPRGSMPRIYGGPTAVKDSVIFENMDYQNPTRIVYRQTGEGYERNTYGMEDGEEIAIIHRFTGK